MLLPLIIKIIIAFYIDSHVCACNHTTYLGKLCLAIFLSVVAGGFADGWIRLGQLRKEMLREEREDINEGIEAYNRTAEAYQSKLKAA